MNKRLIKCKSGIGNMKDLDCSSFNEIILFDIDDGSNKEFIIKLYNGSMGVVNKECEEKALVLLEKFGVNIPKTYDMSALLESTKPYLVMECIDGDILEHILKSENSLFKKFTYMNKYVNLINTVHSLPPECVTMFGKIKDEVRQSNYQITLGIIQQSIDKANTLGLYDFSKELVLLLQECETVEWGEDIPNIIHRDLHLGNIIQYDKDYYLLDWCEAHIGDYRNDLAIIVLYFDKEVADLILTLYSRISGKQCKNMTFFVKLESITRLLLASENIDDFLAADDKEWEKVILKYKKHFEKLYTQYTTLRKGVRLYDLEKRLALLK